MRDKSSPAPGQPHLDHRPPLLQPEMLPKAESVSVRPRLREQALPEKHDDRFFDVWSLQWARELGERAVKAEVLQKLARGVQSFAVWRSLGHVIAAEQENAEDTQTVASTETTVKQAADEATRHLARASAERRNAAGCERRIKVDAVEREKLPPALRGGTKDAVLVVTGNLVVFLTDLFALSLALTFVPGHPLEHWGTAAAVSAGIVLIGDVLGWLAAMGMIRSDASFRRPPWYLIAMLAVILLLATWFIIDLGDFRSTSIQLLAERSHAAIARPDFFTAGQVLLLIGSGALCFTYVARRNGRELLRRQRTAETERNAHLAEAKTLREQAELATRRAAQAQIDSEEAAARIYSRTKVAEALAERDRQQGDYLEPLNDVAYSKARSQVETGIRYWIAEKSDVRIWQAVSRRSPRTATVATLVAGATVFVATGSTIAAVLAGATIVAISLLWRSSQGNDFGASEAACDRLAFKANVDPVSRVTDIERLVPLFSVNGVYKPIDSSDLQAMTDDE